MSILTKRIFIVFKRFVGKTWDNVNKDLYWFKPSSLHPTSIDLTVTDITRLL